MNLNNITDKVFDLLLVYNLQKKKGKKYFLSEYKLFYSILFGPREVTASNSSVLKLAKWPTSFQ